MLGGKLENLLRQKVGPIGNRVVVKHAGELGRIEDCGNVGFHFAPIAAVEVRRQHHQAATSLLSRLLRERDGFTRCQSRYGRDYRHTIAD